MEEKGVKLKNNITLNNKMWKEPLKDKKGTESNYAYQCRLEYCYYIANNPFEEKTIPGFIKHCEIRIKQGEFTSPKKPTQNTVYNKWFARWKWKETANQYMKDTSQEDKELASLIYDMNLLTSTKTLMERLNDLYDELESALDDNYTNNNEKHLIISKIINEIDSLEKLIRLKLDKSVNNTQTKNNVEMEHDGLKRLADAFK